MNFAGAEARIRRRSFRGNLGHQHADLITTEFESAARRIVDRCQIPAGLAASAECWTLRMPMVEVAIPPGAVMADAIVPVVPVADVPATAVVPVVGGCRKPEMLTMAESSPATSSGVPA